jgi:beta-galactosidase/beta-glucuronidase
MDEADETAGAVRGEYPRPSFRREAWASLNGEWEFGAGAEATFDRRIVVPFCAEAELSSIGEIPGDVVWYRRGFDAPEAERLLLHFGAVDYRATVWLNDVEVGRHAGGHTPFVIDVTEATRARDNVLVVRAEDTLTDRTIPRGKQYWKPEPEGIFYTPTTGIWQTVWLEPVPARRIRRLRVEGRLDDGAVDIEVEADGPVDVVARLDGQVVGNWSGSSGRGSIQLSEVVPWHPDSPRLYDLECTTAGDRVESYFGLRKVETKDGKVWLNGAPFVERLVLDQGYWPDGLLTAPSDAALRRDIELAKAFGFNGARKHQKIEDPRWLYWADTLGFLVWTEMPSFHEHTPEAEHRLAAEWASVVQRDRGHPCVVAWVVANESFGLGDVEPSVRSRFLVRLYDQTRELDATRPIVSNDGWQHAISDLCTIHDYSPPDVMTRRYRELATAFEGAEGHAVFDPGFAYAGQPVLVTEFGGLRVAGEGGWGWLEVPDGDELVRSYGRLIDAFMEPGPVQGFCYTQLTDVQQEQNGLLTAGRRPKADVDSIRMATQRPKSGS